MAEQTNNRLLWGNRTTQVRVLLLLSLTALLANLSACPEPCRPFDETSGEDGRRDTARQLVLTGTPLDDRVDACAGDNTDWKYLLPPGDGYITVRTSIDNPNTKGSLMLHDGYGRPIHEQVLTQGVLNYEFTMIPVEKAKYFYKIQVKEGATIYSVGATFIPWDSDQDGVTYPQDNCPETANPYQLDNDGDSLGDVCDEDMDGDNIINTKDPDMDGDGILNDDDPDIDGDNILNEVDPDIDGDGLLNGIDPDIDGDSIVNEHDDTPMGGTTPEPVPDPPKPDPPKPDPPKPDPPKPDPPKPDPPKPDPPKPKEYKTLKVQIILLSPDNEGGGSVVRLGAGKSSGLEKGMVGTIKGTNHTVTITSCKQQICESKSTTSEKQLKKAKWVLFKVLVE